MTQPNMRRLLKQPHISLRDGGEVSPWSLRGIIQNVQSAVTPTPPTPEQAQRARELADYKARAAAERSAPTAQPAAPQPTAQTAAPMGSQTIIDGRMKAAGLRDGGDLRTGQGGHVPGTGAGDKIPAKYEPGEFVVSNAMLDAAPGLREELHDLRGNVLAKQGKSVAQADAEAVSYGGTTGEGHDGFAHEGNEGRGGQAAHMAGLDSQGGGGGSRQLHPVHKNVTLRANKGGELVTRPNFTFGNNELPMSSANRQLATQPNFTFGDNSAPTASANRQLVPRPGSVGPAPQPSTALVPTGQPGSNGTRPNFTMGGTPPEPSTPFATRGGNPNVGSAGSAEAQAFRAGRAAPPVNVAEGAAQAARPSLRAGLAAESRVAGKLAYGAGRALAPVAKVAGALGPIAAGADVVSHFNDYKINDPDVDSSNSGTMRALREGDFAGAGRSFSKGALEAGMDLGSYAANTADLFVPGQGPSKAYNRMLRDTFGDQLIDRSGNGPEGVQPRTASSSQAAQSPSLPTNRMGQGYDDPRRVNADPSRANLGASRDFTNELGAVPKDLPSDLREGVIHKTVGPNGTTVYSGRNVSGDAQFVDGKGATTGSRGGVTSLPGMSQAQIDSTLTNPNGSRWSTADNATMAANLRDGVDPYRGTSRQPQGQGQDDPLAALRAKAMDSNAIGHNGAARMLIAAEQNQALREGHRMNYDAAMAGHNMTRNGNLARLQYDMNKDQRDFQTGRSDKMHEQSRQAEDDFQKHAVEATTERGPDGKPMQDPTAAADYMRTVRHTIAQTIQDPNTSPEIRERLRAKGLAGLDVADRAAFANLYKTRQIQTADHGGINPFKSKGDVSDDLRDYKPNGEDNTLLQKRVRNNMGSVPVTSLQYGPDANHIGWNSGPADQTLVPKKLRD